MIHKRQHHRILYAAAFVLLLLTAALPAQAAAWQTPCVGDTYDYIYQDDRMSIVIDKIDTGKIVYYVADVQVSDPTYLQTALSGGQINGKSEKLSKIAADNNAVFAVNGDFYTFHKHGTIIRNGQLLRSSATTRNMLIVDKNGELSVIADRSNENPKQLSKGLVADGTWQTFEFGPELVRDGQAVGFDKDFNIISTRTTRREPRTAIGQIGALHYIFIVSDGRQEGYSIGMTLKELQELFIAYGAKVAMNLDGGGSAEMYFQGEILNRPCEGGERPMSDIILVK